MYEDRSVWRIYMLTVGLKGIKKETRFGRREKKVNVSAVFCILVSVVCYFEFI